MRRRRPGRLLRRFHTWFFGGDLGGGLANSWCTGEASWTLGGRSGDQTFAVFTASRTSISDSPSVVVVKWWLAVFSSPNIDLLVVLGDPVTVNDVLVSLEFEHVRDIIHAAYST